MSRLKLTEIFYSLQGEADSAGIPTTFVRLTGCPLRCQYCDTAYAFHGGDWWELPAILAAVRAATGGAGPSPGTRRGSRSLAATMSFVPLNRPDCSRKVFSVYFKTLRLDSAALAGFFTSL